MNISSIRHTMELNIGILSNAIGLNNSHKVSPGNIVLRGIIGLTSGIKI